MTASAEFLTAVRGQISHCASQSCSYRCCDFAAGNYIVLYPGELEEAAGRGEALEHLEISPDGLGGHRAICHARDTANCDGGYKPLDCASYPFFPTVDDAGTIQTQLKGSKCPLQAWHLAEHAHWVQELWQELVDHSPDLADWIRATKLIGYTEIRSQ